MSVKQSLLPSLPSLSTECLSRSTGRLKEDVLPLMMPCMEGGSWQVPHWVGILSNWLIGGGNSTPTAAVLLSCDTLPSPQLYHFHGLS